MVMLYQYVKIVLHIDFDSVSKKSWRYFQSFQLFHDYFKLTLFSFRDFSENAVLTKKKKLNRSRLRF